MSKYYSTDSSLEIDNHVMKKMLSFISAVRRAMEDDITASGKQVSSPSTKTVCNDKEFQNDCE